MKCIFNSLIECPMFKAQKELGYTPNVQEIRDKECPQCPYGIDGSKTNQTDVQKIIPSHGNYIV